MLFFLLFTLKLLISIDNVLWRATSPREITRGITPITRTTVEFLLLLNLLSITRTPIVNIPLMGNIRIIIQVSIISTGITALSPTTSRSSAIFTSVPTTSAKIISPSKTTITVTITITTSTSTVWIFTLIRFTSGNG